MSRYTALIAPIFIIFCNCCVIITVQAQGSDVLMTNSRPVNTNRYQGIKGTPYMYEEWQTGKVISVNADIIDGLLLNFNGQTGGFEIKKGNNFIELAPKWYARVIITEANGATTIFQKNFLPPLKDKFTRQVYKGKKITVVEDFTTKTEKKVVNNVGKNEEFNRFYSKKSYFLIKDRKTTPLRLKKKSILALLGHKSALEAFLKKEKLKLNTEADLVELLNFYETSGLE